MPPSACHALPLSLSVSLPARLSPFSLVFSSEMCILAVTAPWPPQTRRWEIKLTRDQRRLATGRLPQNVF